jgi:DNA polymerase-1
VIAAAEKDGYVTTLGGRRRKLSDINSADWKRKGTAERQAVSTRVQGTAADVVRRAMLAARKAVDPSVARICLQVHDEVSGSVSATGTTTSSPSWSTSARTRTASSWTSR